MQSAAKIGDVVCHGGAIASGSGNTTINGSNAAIMGGSVASCSIHGAAPIACGSGSVFINGASAARLGDISGCGAAVVSGSGDVYIGG